MRGLVRVEAFQNSILAVRATCPDNSESVEGATSAAQCECSAGFTLEGAGIRIRIWFQPHHGGVRGGVRDPA